MREREWMNEFYFTSVVEKTRGLFTSSPRPWGKLLLTKDTMSYSMLSTCTFIQAMLKWTPVNRETSRYERETETDRQTDRNRQTDRQTEREREKSPFLFRNLTSVVHWTAERICRLTSICWTRWVLYSPAVWDLALTVGPTRPVGRPPRLSAAAVPTVTCCLHKQRLLPTSTAPSRLLPGFGLIRQDSRTCFLFVCLFVCFSILNLSCMQALMFPQLFLSFRPDN